jgi:hypothetical protein
MEEQRKKIISDLILFEKEEIDLIAMYKVLAKLDIGDLLNKSEQKEYRESLNKLHYESIRHQGIMTEFLNKYREK